MRSDSDPCAVVNTPTAGRQREPTPTTEPRHQRNHQTMREAVKSLETTRQPQPRPSAGHQADSKFRTRSGNLSQARDHLAAQDIGRSKGRSVKATHPAAQHGRHSRRWLPLSVVAALLLIAGLTAALAMASSPKRASQAALAATPPGTTADRGIGAVDTSASAPTWPTWPTWPTQPSTSPHTTAPTHTPASTTKSTTRPSTTPSSTGAQSRKAASPAGLIQPGVTYQGVATEYSAADGDGACLFGPSSDMMIAAMNERDYQNSEACGSHILVRAAGGATVTVLITNECPYPCAPGQLDLSQQAFAKIADPKAGQVPVTWQLVSPATTGTISIRYKTGSSQYWCAIQAIGERNPVTRLEVSTGSGWQQLPRSSYNYFISAKGTGCGKAIRLTDIYGQQLTAAAMPIEPDVAQPAGVQFAQH